MINGTRRYCITISWREAKNSQLPWHAVSDHDQADTEEEHPLGHHHQPSAAKLIHHAFSGCKRANVSKARTNTERHITHCNVSNFSCSQS